RLICKPAPKLKVDKLSSAQVIGAIFGVAGGVVLLCFWFFMPYLYRRLEKDDWTIKWYHIFYGPLLLRRGEVPPRPEDVDAKVVPDYYRGHKTAEELAASDVSKPEPYDVENGKGTEISQAGHGDHSETAPAYVTDIDYSGRWYRKPFDGPWFLPKN